MILYFTRIDKSKISPEPRTCSLTLLFFDTIYSLALDKYIEYMLIWERAYSYV
jgi:hypothetical protein